MFEIGDKKQANIHALDDARRNGSDVATESETHELDSADMQAMHAKLLGYYVREMDIQAENRIQMAIDEDFYDGIQWSETDSAELEERGQKPIVYNVISASVDWVTGSEKRARSDFKVLPRRKKDGKPAERKTQLIKYLADSSRSQFHLSRAFEDAVRAGIGWIDDGVQDGTDDEPIYSRYESWRNVFFDSAASEMDLSDGRYIGRTKWVDLDIAVALFPERANILRNSVEQNNGGGGLFSMWGDDAMDSREIAQTAISPHTMASDVAPGDRPRVRLIEIWFRAPKKLKRIVGGVFSGELFDDRSPGHTDTVTQGEAETREKVDMRMHVAIMTEAGLIYYGESPYRHNRFPLTPIWGYRRGRDGLPYGMIRRLRDIQEDINKRASKALYILSTNKMVVEEGTSDDMAALIEEAQRPDGVMVVKSGRLGSVKMHVERDLPQYHLELMSRSIAMVQQASGVTDELLGRRTNASSGIAIQRRQDQGTMATSSLFDNLRFAQQVRGEKLLSLVEQFVTEEKAFRITNMRGTPEYVTVNDGTPENDIARSKADFVISEADWRASIRQAAVDELLDVMGKLAPVAPQLVMVMLDLVVESMDVPNRDELVRRLRQVTGQQDPDSEEPSPEMVQHQQQQAAQQKLQTDLALAGLAKLTADTDRISAQAEKLRADIVAANVAAQQTALVAAGTAAASPGVLDVADHILGESGFVARSEKQAPMAAPPAQAPGLAPPQSPQPAPGEMQ
jgi:hypothetical protein